jgi:hypothetical protein
MGGEKGELEAKTYGASTLLVKHVTFPKGDKITLDFLGKDSIRYKKTLIVDARVVNNLKDFISNKSKNTPLFDLVNANSINCYLKTFDKGLKGKVFRTRLGSTLMYEELAKTKLKKNATESDKKKAFVNANIIVAKALNHQKTIAKGAVATLDKLKVQLKELEKELKEKKNAGTKVASLEKRVKSKKDSIESKKKLQEISTGTSLTNYIDPRLVTSWCNAHNLPIEKVYTKTLQDKFKWAIDETDDKWDYKNSQLLPDFEKLQPSNDTICDTYNVKTIKKPIVIKQNKYSDDSSSDDSSSDDSSSDYSSSDDNKPIFIKKNKYSDDKTKDLIHNKNKAIIESYHNILKKCGYSLGKLDNNRLAVQRVTPPKMVMQLTSTYKDIYEISNKLKNENLGVLGMLLIGQVCFDATKNVKIKKVLVKSGYIEKYKELVRKAL